MSSLVLLGHYTLPIQFAITLDRLNGQYAEVEKSGDGEEVEFEPKTLVQKLAADGKIVELIEQVAQYQANIVSASDEDFISFFSLWSSLFSSLPAKSLDATLKQVAAILHANTDSPITRVKVATSILNVLLGLPAVSVDVRFEFFLNNILSYGLKYPTTIPLILSSISTFKQLQQAWKLSKQQINQFWAVAYSLAKLQHKGEVSLLSSYTHPNDYLFEYLQSFTPELLSDASTLKSGVMFAQLCVETCLRSSHEFNYVNTGNSPSAAPPAPISHVYEPTTLFPLHIIQHMAKSNSSEHNFLFNALKLITQTNVKEYQAFADKHAAQYKQFNLDAANLLQKIRTLALCNLSLFHDKLSYSLIKEKLLLADSSSVENSVIDGVMSGRLDAKMDQEHETVYIKRVMGGVSTHLYQAGDNRENWKALANKLATWRANIHHVLANMNAHAQTEELLAVEEAM